VPLRQGLLAEIEAQDGVERALARIEEALALTSETGEHWSDAFLHRLRGEILLKRDPANTAAAEEVFLVAIDIAWQQKAHSFAVRRSRLGPPLQFHEPFCGRSCLPHVCARRLFADPGIAGPVRRRSFSKATSSYFIGGMKLAASVLTKG
jgi:hypothetical protein